MSVFSPLFSRRANHLFKSAKMGRLILFILGSGSLLFLENAAGDVIDLSRPVSESLTTITGIYVTGNTLNEENVTPDSSTNGYHLKGYAGTTSNPETNPLIGDIPTLTTGVDRPGTSGFSNAIRLSTPATASGGPGNPKLQIAMPRENALSMVGKDFTGGIWVSFNSLLSVSSGTTHRIVLMDRGGFNINNGTNRGHWGLGIERNINGQWRLVFNTGNGASTNNLISNLYTDSLPPLQLDEWYHFGFTYDYNEEGDNVVTFWMNGETIGTATTSLNITTLTESDSDYETTRRFVVGERAVSTYLSVFDGSVDDIFVTEGIHTFAIPEPSLFALLGLGATILFGTRRKI